MDFGVIAACVRDALAQAADPRFRGVLLRGIALTLALLGGVSLAVFWGLQWLLPETIGIPWLGEVAFVDDLLSWGALLLVLALSVFLMIPVAAAFIGLFLDEVADAVEARHYPHLPPARRIPPGEALRAALSFLAVIVAANLAALVAYVLLAPLAPLIFYALNGFLLAREYYRMVADRRLGRAGAKSSFRRNLISIWGLGVVMAVPLTVPVLNLVVPILGAAAFTHLFHRLGTR